MQCVTPMFYRYPLGEFKKGKIIPREQVMGEAKMNPWNIRESIENYKKINSKFGLIKVPCNHCYACSLTYSAEKATLMMLETQKSDQNYFITLTYDEEHLPIAEEQHYTEPLTGEKIDIPNQGDFEPTLVPEDMKTFINTLKRHYNRKGINDIKYMYCGEYGETTDRPHYHLILCNCPLETEEFYSPKQDTDLNMHYHHKYLDKIWGKGLIDIAEVTFNSCAYVARYCAKKRKENYDKLDLLKRGKYPEFIRTSVNLGKDYYEENKENIYETDELIMKTLNGNVATVKPPKKFDEWYQKEKPIEMMFIKNQRKREGEIREKNKYMQSDYNDIELLMIEAEKLKMKEHMLRREQGEEPI